MNGIIVVNKEIGYTSRDIVNIISRTLGTKKVGHTGTLDPMACGVLVVCVGDALKVCELLTNHDKEYIAGITLGIETDTLDTEGTILSTENVDISKEKIIDVVNSFVGEYNQEVPKYSAVKVNGKKLYEYARSNIPVVLPSRNVLIKDIKIIDEIIYEDGKIHFTVKCSVSKGTYIRSLVRDIGSRLGTVAVMNSLIRTRQGNFNLEQAYSLADIEEKSFNFIDITYAFSDIPKIIVDDCVAFKIKNGVILDKFFDSEMAFILDGENNLLAIYKNVDNKSRAYRVF